MSKVKICKNCGATITEKQAFCGNCGEKILTPKKTGKRVIIIAVISILIFAVLAAYFFLNNESDSGEANSLIQANLSNWGYVVSDDKNIYYYDGTNGIVKYSETGKKEMLISGNYSDMGLLNKSIYCIEYLQSEDGSSSESVIVRINTENGSKEVVYKPVSSEAVIIVSNVINEKYYFILDNDSLFSIDKNGEVENTNIRSAKKITPSGVYTSETSKYGLKLLAIDGKTIKTYPELSNFEVGVLFELDDYVYLNYIDYEEDTTYKLYRLNKGTGELAPFIHSQDLSKNFSYMNMNFHNGKFYIYANYHFLNDDGHHSRHKILSCDYNGDNIDEIYQKESDSSLPLCTLNIANQYLFINYPFTTLEPEIIDLYNQINISGSTEDTSSESSDSTVKSLKFNLLPNGTYSVVGTEGGEGTHIVIPEMYEGITVSAIGDNAFQNWGSLLSVEIPDSIVSIGAHAFEDCNALTDIQIPSNIEFVGEDAFSGSWKLPFAEDITNEYKAYYLGNDENPYLILIEFNHMSSSNRSYSYNVKYGTRVICGDMMMWGYKLANITLPETLVAINDSVFANCTSLREINIPNSVKYIGSSAFHDLEGITEISIPNGINTIKSGLCALCFNLRTVEIPNTVTSIESSAFYFCPNLSRIEFAGTIDEWNSISKADGWDSDCGNYTVYCIDGQKISSEVVQNTEEDNNDIDKESLPKKTTGTTTVADLMPDGKDFEKIDISAYTLPATVSEVYSEDGGFVIKLVTSGYSTGLTIMCGIDSEGNITDAVCLESFETLGYEKKYGKNAIGMNTNTIEKLDTVAGATKTTSGYKNALKDALNSFVILNGGSVDIRTEAEILADNLAAALPAGDTFTEVFIHEVLTDVSAVYVAANGAGTVYVTGEGENAVFVGVDADGVIVSDVDAAVKANIEAQAAILAGSTITEIDLTQYADMPKQVDKAYKTSGGNYVVETRGSGFGINGAYYYNPSGEYIYVKLALTADGKIINCVTVTQSETNGLGSACADKEFYSQFNGKDENTYKDIDAISGATLTTNGYKTAVSRAFEAVKIMEGVE